jgi:hypothetical protein
MLEAPSGEIVVAYHCVADSWGTLGFWEWVLHVDVCPLQHPGIYHWKLWHEDEVLLERPMLAKCRVVKPT